MKLVRDFERRLEQLVDGMAGRVFRGKLHPVEMAARLVREADLSVEEGPAGPSVANVYVLKLNPRDLDAQVPTGLVQELADMLELTAADRGWRMDGPVQVVLKPAEGVTVGTVECRVDRSPGLHRPWAFLAARGGTNHAVRHNRSLIGRAETSDIIIADPGVSRIHALLWREGGEAWIVDLGSANGTGVNGGSANTPRLLSAGSVVTFGPAALTFRVAA
jgi:hypothetical protein